MGVGAVTDGAMGGGTVVQWYSNAVREGAGSRGNCYGEINVSGVGEAGWCRRLDGRWFAPDCVAITLLL